jgi:hypothetical protein
MAKAGKQEIAKARASLTTERLRLKDDRLALEREWGKLERVRQAITRERAETIPALRILCERYGNNDWHDDMPLVDIIEQHLVAPMAELNRQQRDRLDRLQLRLRRVESPPLPVVRPTPVPSTDPHAVEVVPVPSGRAVPSYQARCQCSWTGPVRPAQHIAEADAGGHQRGNRPQIEARA